MAEVMKWCLDEGCTFVDYVEKYEGSEIFTYLEEVWKQMQETVEKGLVTEGVLPGALKLARGSLFQAFQCLPGLRIQGNHFFFSDEITDFTVIKLNTVHNSLYYCVV